MAAYFDRNGDKATTREALQWTLFELLALRNPNMDLNLIHLAVEHAVKDALQHYGAKDLDAGMAASIAAQIERELRD